MPSGFLKLHAYSLVKQTDFRTITLKGDIKPCSIHDLINLPPVNSSDIFLPLNMLTHK